MQPLGAPVIIVVLSWLTFLIVWVVTGAKAKGYVRRNANSWILRVAIIVSIAIFYTSQTLRDDFTLAEAGFATLPVRVLGALLCVLGIAIAIWARVYLGRNWGMPMSLKQDPELVTTGPYAYVRHPIYSGMLLAMLGSCLVSLWWLPALVLFGAYFIYSGKVEEGIMQKEFPGQYPDYMKRTKMLVPFIF